MTLEEYNALPLDIRKQLVRFGQAYHCSVCGWLSDDTIVEMWQEMGRNGPILFHHKDTPDHVVTRVRYSAV